MSRILIVDDEPPIVELVKFNLQKEGYEVLIAYDGITAIERAVEEKPNLIILDIMLPEVDGFEVCRNLSQNPQTKDIPIIMLTARGEEIDKILGLEFGADDYITKPFSPRELMARVKARLRRITSSSQKEKAEEEILTFGRLTINPLKFAIYIDGEKQDFTPKEFELLKYLAQNKGKVFNRDFLLEKIWGYDYSGDTRTVDVHIRHIRQKIEENPKEPEYILTIHGVGYKFKE